MIKKYIGLYFCHTCLVLNIAYCQAKKTPERLTHKIHSGPDRKWGIFTNPFSFTEPQVAAAGVGLSYRLVKRIDLSLEYNYLFAPVYRSGKVDGLTGYRGIFTIKRFSKSRIFFYGIDLRIKHYSFIDKQNFINPAIPDTLYAFSHHASNTLPGIGAITGVRMALSKNKKFAIEFNGGIGFKYRYVSRTNVPAGYKYYRRENSGFHEFFTLPGSRATNEATFYLPAALRLYYFF